MSSSGSCFNISGHHPRQPTVSFLHICSNVWTSSWQHYMVSANAMVWLNIEFSLAHPDKCHCNRFISKAQNFKLSIGKKDSSKENYQEGQERVGRRENEGRPAPVTMHCVHDGHSCTRAAEQFTLKLLITENLLAGFSDDEYMSAWQCNGYRSLQSVSTNSASITGVHIHFMKGQIFFKATMELWCEVV